MNTRHEMVTTGPATGDFCRYCGSYHGALCPLVKRFTYNEDETVASVEFFSEAELAQADLLREQARTLREDEWRKQGVTVVPPDGDKPGYIEVKEPKTSFWGCLHGFWRAP